MLHAAETVSAPTVSVLPWLVWHLPTLFPRGFILKKLFVKSRDVRMQKYFKTNARVSWELSNTKTLKAHSGFISFPVFGNHDKPPFAVFAVLHPC